MGLLYQKRRLKVNKVKRLLNSRRVFLLRFRILLSLVMVVGICYCGIKVLRLPMWYIDQEKINQADPYILKISGNKITPKSKIIEMVHQVTLPDTQIFRLKTDELENKISTLQPIKKVYVRRFWFPARLNILIDERTPVFLLSPNLETEPNCVITADGAKINNEFLPFIDRSKTKRILTYGVTDGKDEVWNKKKVEEMISLVKAIESYSNQKVQYVDIRKQKDIYIMLQKYLIRFGQIDDSALSRAKWTASILPEAEKYSDKVKYIDLRWENSHYLRLKGSKDAVNKAINLKEDVQVEAANQQPNQQTQEQNQENVE